MGRSRTGSRRGSIGDERKDLVFAPVASRRALLPDADAPEAFVAGRAQTLGTRRAGVTSDGDELLLHGGDQGGRALLIAGRPLREPVVQYGPFVMTTREEVEQAVRDYRNGTLTDAHAEELR